MRKICHDFPVNCDNFRITHDHEKTMKNKKSVEKFFSIFFRISFSIFSWKGLNGEDGIFWWQNGNAITRKWLWTDGVVEKRKKEIGKKSRKKWEKKGEKSDEFE